MPADIFQCVVEYWRRESIPLLPGEPESEIRRTFAELHYPVTPDVIRLYSLTGGFRDLDTDRDYWSLWPLDYLRERNQNSGNDFVWFSDFLICSHVYAFQRETDETSSVYIGWYPFDGSRSEPLRRDRVAGSLATFFEIYLSDPDRIIYP